MSSQVPPLRLANEKSIGLLLSRLRRGKGTSLSSLFHVLHLCGSHALVSDGEPGVDCNQISALNLVLGKHRDLGFFGDSNVITETRYGARYPLIVRGALSKPQPNTEAHPGQGLAILASLGVPLNSPIYTDSGQRKVVRDLLNDVVANFVLDGEIYWDAIGITLYQTDSPEWTNKFARRFTFNDLADELIDRSMNSSPCAGTHKLIALTVLLRTDQANPILDQRHRQLVEQHLASAVQQLTTTELEDGGWDLNWNYRESGTQLLKCRRTPEEFLQATGHHLEWLMLLPEEVQPPISVFERAAEQCLRMLLMHTNDTNWIANNYCLVVHAARSVTILCRNVPSADNDN